MPILAITGNEAMIRNLERPINRAEFFNTQSEKLADY